MLCGIRSTQTETEFSKEYFKIAIALYLRIRAAFYQNSIIYEPRF